MSALSPTQSNLTTEYNDRGSLRFLMVCYVFHVLFDLDTLLSSIMQRVSFTEFYACYKLFDPDNTLNLITSD
jgi:hypothetical protein